MKKFLYVISLVLVLGACTEDFEETNTNPYEITGESLTQDFNDVGAFFPNMLKNLYGIQIDHNLTNDSFARHLATPTPFVGGVNNTTYYLRWNRYWNIQYSNVMSQANQVIDIAAANDNEIFVEWANLIKLLSMQRVTVYYGPVIYTEFGLGKSGEYDSEDKLYRAFFSDLDRIIGVFMANADKKDIAAFDASYGGDLTKWARMANSLRLRLAIRVSKVDPAMAKTEGEKAIADGAGLITTNDDNFNINGYGQKYHPAVICFEWNDTRMSASMESILGGYQDPRAANFFEPVADAALVADHPEFPYKGIRNGADLVAKDARTSFSTINLDFNDPGKVTERKFMSADEIHFLMAEAALRGWAGAGDAGTHYEMGVRSSFALWGTGGVDDYLADNTSIPFDYDDPASTGDVNDFVNRITNTVAWDDAADDETKLEKIITQKWIAAYTDSMEPWVDHRRTGYPKLPYNYQNDSNSDWGIIADDDFLRRMTFVNGERENNPAAVADGTTKLGGPDEIGTRLWWDTGGSNF
jgi:hypothetical protein